MRKHLNKITNAGGAGVLTGVGIFFTQGGLEPPEPISYWYWIGIAFISLGIIVAIWGWFFPPSKSVTNYKLEIIDKIPQTIQAIWNRLKQLSLNIISENQKTHWLNIYSVGEDIVEAIGLNLNSTIKAIEKPYKEGKKKIVFNRVKKRIAKTDIGQDTNEMMEIALPSMGKHDAGLYPIITKDKPYQKLLKTLRKQQHILVDDSGEYAELDKGLATFEDMAYKLNNLRIGLQYCLDFGEKTDKKTLLKLTEKKRVLDDEIEKYIKPILITLSKIRNNLEQ